jgi:hypothetical protein
MELKELCSDGCLGFEPTKFVMLCASTIEGKHKYFAPPLLDYALAFYLQLGKLNENSNKSRQSKLQSKCCVNLAALLEAASDASLTL